MKVHGLVCMGQYAGNKHLSADVECWKVKNADLEQTISTFEFIFPENFYATPKVWVYEISIQVTELLLLIIKKITIIPTAIMRPFMQWEPTAYDASHEHQNIPFMLVDPVSWLIKPNGLFIYLPNRLVWTRDMTQQQITNLTCAKSCVWSLEPSIYYYFVF